jgi:hypothetical protein
VAGWLNYHWSLEEEKVLLLDADCLQGMVLVPWVLVKEPSLICVRVVCVLFSTIFCKREQKWVRRVSMLYI